MSFWDSSMGHDLGRALLRKLGEKRKQVLVPLENDEDYNYLSSLIRDGYCVVTTFPFTNEGSEKTITIVVLEK